METQTAGSRDEAGRCNKLEFLHMHCTPNPYLGQFLDILKGVRQSGDGYIALCPAHDDHDPSLSIGVGNDGRVLLKCHAGCASEDVLRAIGLTFRDLYPDQQQQQQRSAGNQQKRPGTQPRKARDGRRWEIWARVYADMGRDKLGELAGALGVSEESLQSLLVGWASRDGGCWTFPERDDAGRIIGIMRRFKAGDKIFLPGGNRGLYFTDDFSAPPGPIYVVEGGSCTAAGLTMGLAVVGRFSNVGGVKFLTKLLSNIPKDREIIVMGERDEKPDGTWPGRDGAMKTAARLANGLNRPVSWELPPEGAKDMREWLLLKRK